MERKNKQIRTTKSIQSLKSITIMENKKDQILIIWYDNGKLMSSFYDLTIENILTLSRLK